MRINENVDFTTATGQLMFHMLAAFAQFERQLLRDRVKAGLANARARGKVLGRPRKVVEPERLRPLRQGKLSVRSMARPLGASVGPVQKTVKNSSS